MLEQRWSNAVAILRRQLHPSLFLIFSSLAKVAEADDKKKEKEIKTKLWEKNIPNVFLVTALIKWLS